MQRLPIQVSVSALLIVVAGVALNVWLFRFGALAGILGLSVTKHLAIAWLCQVLGIDHRAKAARRPEADGVPLGVATPPGPLPRAAPASPPVA